MHPAIIIGTVLLLIVDVAMGQIPRSTERISSLFKLFMFIAIWYLDDFDEKMTNLAKCFVSSACEFPVASDWVIQSNFPKFDIRPCCLIVVERKTILFHSSSDSGAVLCGVYAHWRWSLSGDTFFHLMYVFFVPSIDVIDQFCFTIAADITFCQACH